MKKILFALPIVALLAAGCNSSQQTTALLQDSDISNLVSFLKNNSLQAAVIEQVLKPNSANVWLVKSDGQKILIYQKDLGTYTDITNQDRYNIDIAAGAVEGVSLLPDYIEVYDNKLNKTFDISKYIKNFQVDPNWDNTVAEKKVWSNSSYYAGSLSPDGKHELTYDNASTGNMQLNQVQYINGQFSNKLITTFPNSRKSIFVSWSPDGNYLLIRTVGGIAKGLDIYDIRNNKTNHVDDSLAIGVPAGNTFTSFAYPSEVIFSKNDINGQGGTFAINFANNEDQVSILPNQIKMVGLIPLTSEGN